MNNQRMAAHVALLNRLIAVQDHLVVLEGAIEAYRRVARECLHVLVSAVLRLLRVAALDDEDFV